MSLSRLKERLKQFKSTQSLNLPPPQHQDKRATEISHLGNLRLSRPKRQIQSRLVTQTHDKVALTKKELNRYAKILKINTKPKKNQNKIKHNNSSKGININVNSTKRLTKEKFLSPNMSRVHPKKQHAQIASPLRNFLQKQKKGLKKAKNSQQKWRNEHHHNQSSILLQKGKFSKSREAISRMKSRKKMHKICTETSLQSTPSSLLTQEVELLNQIGEGTFGKVFKGKLKRNGEIVAVKRVLQDSHYRNRQMQIIKLVKDDFICQVIGSYITQQGNHQYLNIIMRFYQENLYQRIKSYPVGKMPNLQTKIIIYQLFKGLSYLHSKNVCHRDIKPENLLLKTNRAVICDFGSAKILLPGETNISYICARCYRAPELIFGATKYSTQVDIWSAGCVILQILNGDPLFIGETSINHLLQIIKILGTPKTQEVLAMNPEYDIKTYKFPEIQKKYWNEVFPDADNLLLKVLNRVMVYSPRERLTAIEILALQYFDQLRDQLTYLHISSMYHLNNFFKFSNEELANYEYLAPKLIPKWLTQ